LHSKGLTKNKQNRQKHVQATAANISQRGDGVATNSKTVDEVAGSDEGPTEQGDETAGRVAERSQSVDLLRYTTAARHRPRLSQQPDGKSREEAIQRVG